MSKVGVGLLLTVALILVPLYAAHAELKVGIVDGMEVISKSAEGKRVQDAIKHKSDELGRPFAQKRQDLARQLKEFQDQASLMKESARKRKAEELQKKMKDFERQGADAEKQLAQYQQQQLAPLFHKLESAVNTVAREKGLDLVLDKRNAGILYLDPKLDITQQVRQRFGP
jgi:outer membrane protein